MRWGDLGCRHRGESGNKASPVNRDVCCSYVVSKLILASVAHEETIEIYISGSEIRSAIPSL